MLNFEIPHLTVLDILVRLSTAHEGLWSTERPCQRASNSELRRWIERGSVEINSHVDRDPKEVVDYPVLSVVVHPKSEKRRLTLR